MEILKQFEDDTTCLFRILNGRSVAIWGYNYESFFIMHIFHRHNKTVEAIIDDDQSFFNGNFIRSTELPDLKSQQFIVLLTGKTDDNKEKILSATGFIAEKDFYYIRDFFWGKEKREKMVSYYDYLEYQYGLDIIRTNKIKRINDRGGYSTGTRYAIVDVLDEFCFSKDDAVFDIGCGKGGALLMFYYEGIRKLGGVEYEKELYDILKDNFEKMNISSDYIYNCDATEIKNQLDDFNVFFLYNPFWGDTFKSVINNIMESSIRNPRKITLIYAGPECHDLIVENSNFILTKKIHCDYYISHVNIYQNLEL